VSSTRMARKDRGLDFYETPEWVTEAILPHVPACTRIVDPCAGRGAILDAMGWPEGAWGVEIDADRVAGTGPFVRVYQGDALGADPWTHDKRRAELVIMNPPFLHALAFVERALAEVLPGGSVFALLRLAFLEGAARVPFHRRAPADVYVLPRRPSFTGKGTDSSAYAWFAWGPGRGGRWSVLDVPPPSGRRSKAEEEGEHVEQ
jgi:hypothetical protein